MALHTLALAGTVPCLGGWMMPTAGATVTAADVAAIYEGSCDDGNFGTLLQGLSFGRQAVIATGTTNGTTSITSVTKRAGATFLPVTQIQVGDLILGIGVTPGTYVRAVAAGGATITASRATTNGGAGVGLIFVRAGSDQLLAGPSPMGQLFIPGRGSLKILPGDAVAVDNTGWPILISAAALAYAASQWTLT